MHETNGFIGKEKDNPRVAAQTKGKIAIDSFKNTPPPTARREKMDFPAGQQLSPSPRARSTTPSLPLRINQSNWTTLPSGD